MSQSENDLMAEGAGKNGKRILNLCNSYSHRVTEKRACTIVTLTTSDVLNMVA